MNKKSATAIISVLILSTVVVGMRLFVSTTNVETTSSVATKPSAVFEAESTTIEEPSSTTEEPTTKETTVEQTTTTTKPSTTKQSTTKKTTTKKSTTTTTSKVTTTKTSGIVTGFENSMLARVNAARAEEGAEPLILDSNLNKLARIRAEEIAQDYRSNHARPDGSVWSTVLDGLAGTELENWTGASENIAYGQIDEKSAFEAFHASPSHLAAMTTSYYTHCGFGCYSKQGVLYWVQLFIGVE